jgi:hypothetical protein
LLAVFLGGAVPLTAQSWSLDTDLTYASRYEWRGLVHDPGANLQQAAYLSVLRGNAIVTGGFWWVTDLSPNDDELPSGLESRRSPWIEGSYGSDRASAFLGLTAHLRGGSRPASDTWEAYAGAVGMLPGWPLRLEGALFWDVQRVRGAYMETAAALQVPLWTGLLVPVGSLFLEGRLGSSFGQERPGPGVTSDFYFERAGVSHLDVSLHTTSTPVAFWKVAGSVTLETRWTRGFDPATKGTGADQADRWSWSLGLHLTAPTCRPTRELCEDL